MPKLKLLCCIIASSFLLFCSFLEPKDKYWSSSTIIFSYSKEDSLRIENDLLPFDLNWRLDSINLGTKDQFDFWQSETDHPNIKNLPIVKKYFYSLDYGQDFVIKKEIQIKSIDSTIIEEGDFYRRYIKDSTMEVGLFIILKYENMKRISMIDTLDYVKRDSINLIEKKLAAEREEQEKSARLNGYYLRSAGLDRDFFTRYYSYKKTYYLDSIHLKAALKQNFGEAEETRLANLIHKAR